MSRNGGGAENDSKTDTSGKEIFLIPSVKLFIVLQLLVINFIQFMIPRFSFLTAGKPYVPGSRER